MTLRYYQRALKLTPQDARLLNALGLTHYEARYSMSTLLAHMGQLQEAESQMQQVLQARDTDQRCRNSLGMVQLQ
ncbi:tetratricopeptide repeat protein [Pantoea endophytica]|uniref:tetratricopeptide repeat protein n=1 Tax=Pantoea endophytica TaxID=92488 RepID=UPI0024130E31|nr:tetratricopeptide repeat protein [Pantoea endophytica]